MSIRSEVSLLKKRVDKLERDMHRVKEVFGILPPVVKPLEWKELYELDRKVLAFMIKNEDQMSFRTGEIAEALGLPKESGRVQVWKSLKRIRRIGRAKHACILEQDKVAKTWTLRRNDFTFLI
jgi:hypothetical protein